MALSEVTKWLYCNLFFGHASKFVRIRVLKEIEGFLLVSSIPIIKKSNSGWFVLLRTWLKLAKSLILVNVVPGRPHRVRHELATILRDFSVITRLSTIRKLYEKIKENVKCFSWISFTCLFQHLSRLFVGWAYVWSVTKSKSPKVDILVNRVIVVLF